MEIKEVRDGITLLGVDYIGGDENEEELLKIIKENDPDRIGLALCEKRFETLEGKEDWKKKPLLPSYKEGKTGALIYQAFMDALHENLRRFKGVEPEIHVARLVPVIDRLDIDVEFIDRDVTLTLGRAFRGMSPLEKLKMIWLLKSAMLSFSGKGKFKSIEKIEHHDDLVEGVFDNVEQFAPRVAHKARRERNEYMAKKIYELSKKGSVLAIVPESKVGDVAENIQGVERQEILRGEATGVKHLERIGKRVYTKVLRFASPTFFILLAVYLFFFSDVMNIWRAWLYWFLAVGGMSALGSAFARGHPLSIITSFILAPFMSLTLIGPGWIAGYVELKVRNPKVSDLKSLTSSKSAGDMLANNVIRVFLVGTFSNIFTWLGLFIVLPLLIRFVG